jgi:hypothetical protein
LTRSGLTISSSPSLRTFGGSMSSQSENEDDDADGGGGGGSGRLIGGPLSVSSELPTTAGSPTDEGPGSAGGARRSSRDKLPRTLSTSVLRIKHRSTFWDKVWEQRFSREAKT